VLSLFHQDGNSYDEGTTRMLDKVGVRPAMQAVLRLEAARHRNFQFKLLKLMAQATTDRGLARLVVTELAGFYEWQNVSIFKVNVLQRQFELLEQAKASRDGFDLPDGYCQSLDVGFLGRA